MVGLRRSALCGHTSVRRVILLKKARILKLSVTQFRSLGGMIVDGGQSVTAWGINVGSKLAQGVSKLYSNIFSSAAASTKPSCHHPSSLPSATGPGCMASGSSCTPQDMQKGIVTILDVLQVCNLSEVK